MTPLSPAMLERISSRGRAVARAAEQNRRLQSAAAGLSVAISGDQHVPPSERAALESAAARFVEHPAFTRTLTRA